MRKLSIFIGLMLMLTMTVAAQLPDTRTFQPLDRGFAYRFDYPINTHSVRTSNLTEPANINLSFGSLISVEPNDSYLYADDAQPTYFTRMRVLAGYNPEPMADDADLTQYLGTSPLLAYDPADAVVEAITLGGQPAVRASGIPQVPGAGITEIIAVYEGLLYQIVIEPVPLQLGFDPSDDMVLDSVYEAILDTWVFEQPAI